MAVSGVREPDRPMGKRIDLSGVNTWYEDRGAGETVVLMHGGFTDSRDFGGNLDRLTSRFRCLFPERRGHGHTPDVEGPISGEIMATDTIRFIEQIIGGPVPLIGYSAGAMVALWTAARRPDLVSRLVLISGAFDADGMLFKPAAGVPMPPPLVTAYGEVSPDGVDHFPVVQAKIARAAAEDSGLTPNDLERITCPVLVVSADDDLVTLEHTITLYRSLPDAQLAIVPGSSHLLLHEKPEFCVNLVVEFMTRHPIPTLMPIRRAASHRPSF
jgi:pimeloyl-ACP methyl ester carboxylesterase